mmetsp:Transcript_28327/g.66472  ORF Transcript_28327/g.66472 Transcript_28327/m.66472 type:complete len:354 (-) Transcript_28327:637-1698(-)
MVHVDKLRHASSSCRIVRLRHEGLLPLILLTGVDEYANSHHDEDAADERADDEPDVDSAAIVAAAAAPGRRRRRRRLGNRRPVHDDHDGADLPERPVVRIPELLEVLLPVRLAVEGLADDVLDFFLGILPRGSELDHGDRDDGQRCCSRRRSLQPPPAAVVRSVQLSLRLAIGGLQLSARTNHNGRGRSSASLDLPPDAGVDAHPPEFLHANLTAGPVHVVVDLLGGDLLPQYDGGILQFAHVVEDEVDLDEEFLDGQRRGRGGGGRRRWCRWECGSVGGFRHRGHRRRGNGGRLGGAGRGGRRRWRFCWCCRGIIRRVHRHWLEARRWRRIGRCRGWRGSLGRRPGRIARHR